MARNLDSKCALCRRAGEKLFLKADRCNSPKCAVVRRASTPGVHGKPFSGGGRGRSEYGQQLAQKQKIKRIYSVSESQFRKHLADVEKLEGVTGDNLINRLEMRFDNVVYRLGLASSRAQARQLVGHSLFLVNGKTLNIPSAKMKVGDVVEVKPSKKGKKFFQELQAILKKSSKPAGWLAFDADKMEGKVVSKPSMDEVGMNVDAQVVVEFYSR